MPTGSISKIPGAWADAVTQPPRLIDLSRERPTGRPSQARLRIGISDLPTPYPIQFRNGASALARDVSDQKELAGALHDIAPPRPVLVLVGGAKSMAEAAARQISPMLKDGLVPLLQRNGAAVIDGGTDSGVMAMIGRARAQVGASFPLIGIAARGTVHLPGGRPPNRSAPPLEPNHTHFLLVPGDRWGDESPWIGAAASALADGAPSATLVVGGGKITRLDLELSLRAGRQTLVLAGSGGTADDLYRGLRTRDLEVFGIDEKRARFLRATDLIDVCAILDALLGDGRSQ